MWAVLHYYAQDAAGTRRASNPEAPLIPSLGMIARASGRDDIQALAVAIDAEAARFAGDWAISATVDAAGSIEATLTAAGRAGRRRHHHAADERTGFTNDGQYRRRRGRPVDDSGGAWCDDRRRLSGGARSGTGVPRQAGRTRPARRAAPRHRRNASHRVGHGNRGCAHTGHDDDRGTDDRGTDDRGTDDINSGNRRTDDINSDNRRTSDNVDLDRAANHDLVDDDHGCICGDRSSATASGTGDIATDRRSASAGRRRAAPEDRKGLRPHRLPRHCAAGGRHRGGRCRQPPSATEGHLHSMR